MNQDKCFNHISTMRLLPHPFHMADDFERLAVYCNQNGWPCYSTSTHPSKPSALHLRCYPLCVYYTHGNCLVLDVKSVMSCRNAKVMGVLAHYLHLPHYFETVMDHNDWPCFHLNSSFQAHSSPPKFSSHFCELMADAISFM